MKTSQLVCDTNELTGFCVVWILLIFFFIQVAFIIFFNYNFPRVKKMQLSYGLFRVPPDRGSFSCRDRSAGEQSGSIDCFFLWFSLKVFNLCVNIFNNSDTLQFFGISHNNVTKDSIYNILHFIITLYVILLLICLTIFE